MKKIGYIDHYLKNVHADVYLKLIREGRFREQFDVAYAYGEVVSEGVDSAQWCSDNGVELLGSPAEVVAKSDCIVVLSPNNPERHWDLCQEALVSGKPVYVDKTFAPDTETAEKLVDMAVRSGTPMFTTSALRFVPELREFLEGIGREHPAQAVSVRGPSSFAVYAVHAIEPLVMLLGRGAKAVTYFGDGRFMQFGVTYPDGRIGGFSLFEPACGIGERWYGHPFEASIIFGEGTAAYRFTTDNMFRDLADAMCEFFGGGPSPAPYEDTLEVMALIEAGRKAMASPGATVAVTGGGK